MGRLKTAVITVSITIIICILLVLYFYMNSVPMNDALVVGNCAGNMNNGGYFLEMDGKIYFRNNYDNGCLYSMNADETNIKQLTSMNVKYISGYGDYLYYHMDSFNVSGETSGLGSATNQFGVYQSKTDGSNQKCLYRGFTGAQNLIGSYVYFQEKEANLGTLQKIRIDKTNLTSVSDEFIDPSCALDGKIYYTGILSDHNLHILNTTSADKTSTFVQGNIIYPIVSGNYVYYMDGDNNYRITRMDTSTGDVKVLSVARADCFNMNDKYIFYATSTESTPSLHVMTLDGSSDYAVLEGIYSNISVTTNYVYFSMYDDESRIWHMKVDGSESPELFNPIVSK